MMAMVAGQHRADPVGTDVGEGTSSHSLAFVHQAFDARRGRTGLARAGASQQEEVALVGDDRGLLVGE